MSSTVTSRPSSKAIGLPVVCAPTSQSSHLSSGSVAADTAGVIESKASKSGSTAEVSSQPAAEFSSKPAAEVRSQPTAEIRSSPSVAVNAAASSPMVANVVVRKDPSPPLPGSIPSSATRALVATSHDCVSTVLPPTNEVSTAATTASHAASIVSEQTGAPGPQTTISTSEVAKKPRAPRKRKAAAATTTTTATTTSATETKKPPRKRGQTSKPLQPVEANKPAANAAIAHEEKAPQDSDTHTLDSGGKPTSVPNDSRNGPPASTLDAFLSLAETATPDQSLEHTLTSLCQYDATTLRQVSDAILTSPTFATLVSRPRCLAVVASPEGGLAGARMCLTNTCLCTCFFFSLLFCSALKSQVDRLGAACSSAPRSLLREGSQNAASQEPSWGSPIRPDPNFRGHD